MKTKWTCNVALYGCTFVSCNITPSLVGQTVVCTLKSEIKSYERIHAHLFKMKWTVAHHFCRALETLPCGVRFREAQVRQRAA
jgi:hypothetical protein